MGTKRTFVAPKVRDFVWANADKPLSAEFVAKEIGLLPTSISSVLAQMVTDFPDQMERIRKGLYRWNSAGVAPKDPEPEADPTELIVEIVGRRDGRMLVRDDKGNLFVMQPFEF